MSAAIYLCASLAAFWLLWVFFLAVMALKRARDDGLLVKGHDAYTLGMSVLLVGWLLDFVVNILVATVIFLEPPFEMTVTSRVTRWKKTGRLAGRSGALAVRENPRPVRNRRALQITMKGKSCQTASSAQ